VEREPRLVHVYAHDVQDVRLPEVDFRLLCSKGFYVRTYAHDIGGELGCGAHLKSLRRTKSGKFSVEGAITSGQLKSGPLDAVLGKIMTLPQVSILRGA
jgi:tRNA pseudouridine55 synthase